MDEYPLFEENITKKVQIEKQIYRRLIKFTSAFCLLSIIIGIGASIIYERNLFIYILLFLIVWAIIVIVLINLIYFDNKTSFQTKFYKDFVAFKNKPYGKYEYDSKWHYHRIKEIQYLEFNDTWSINIKVNAILQTMTKKDYYDDPDGLLNFLKSTPEINYVEM